MDKEITKKTHRTRKELLMIVLLIVTAVILLVIGITYKNNSKPKHIYSTTIKNLYNYTKNIIMTEKHDTNLGNNFSFVSNIKINVSGEKDVFNTEYNPIQLNKYYSNISKTQTTITFNQDMKNKKLLYTIDSQLNNSYLKKHNYLVENSTKYEYLYGLKDNYINRGNARYYETVNSSKDIDYNIEYLMDYIVDSISDNINEEEIKMSKEKTTLDTKEVKLYKYEYQLSDMNLRILINNVINDLKKDERTNNILNIIYPDFKDYTISSKKELLNKKEMIKISIYTNSLYSMKKIDITKVNGNNEKTISVEPTRERIRIVTSENNKIQTISNLVKNKNTYIATINDENNKNIGSVELNSDEKRTTFIVGYSSKNKKIDINFDRNIHELDEKKSYDETISLTMNILDSINMKKIINLNILCNNKYSNHAIIKEDTKNVILYDSLTDKEKEYITQEKERIKNRLLV